MQLMQHVLLDTLKSLLIIKGIVFFRTKLFRSAKANNNGNSALKALELLSRIRGNKSDKENINTPEQLEEKIVASLKILGKEKVITLLKKCDFILD